MSEQGVFVRPETIGEANALLGSWGDGARVLAGGTALVLLMRQRLVQPSALISIEGLTEPELRAVEVDDGILHIGALLTHAEVTRHPTVKSLLPALSRAFGVVGNVRVRNVGTVGGVLAEADYASDPSAVLRLLDASVKVHGPAGERLIPIEQFLVGLYQTTLEPEELVTGVSMPLPGQGFTAVYEKVVTRSSEDRPCIGVAAGLRLSADGTIGDLRVAIGAAAEVPQRFSDIELLASGAHLDDDLLRSIGDQYSERIDAIDDLRGTAWYRKQLVKVWVVRALKKAFRLAAVSVGGGERRVQHDD